MRPWLALVLVAAACKGSSYRVPPNVNPDARAPCTLVTCQSAEATCGPVGDGCGGQIDCGSCPDGQACGGDGEIFQCGMGCVPHDCAAAGAKCGRVADGCGGLTDDCGTCPAGETCGATAANQCGVPPCTGLCTQQNACPNQPKTTITGKVTAPGHTDTATFGQPDPIFGALVYVPNGAAGPPRWGVDAFTPGVSCDTCSSLVTGSPLVEARSAVDGTFTLTNAPCGTNIPLVIQLGRWRREITIPSVACCANTALTAAQTHLPRNHLGEPGDLRSDIPRMAFSTGAVDTLHCVLRKIGIDDSEFGNPNANTRIALYADNGAVMSASTPSASLLVDNASELAKYDMTMFECVGEQDPKSNGPQTNVIDYANKGGRVFATHFSYVWLTDSLGTASSNTGPRPFSQTADWLVNQAQADSVTGTVDQTAQGDPATQGRRIAFSNWLSLTGATSSPGTIVVNDARKDLDSVSPVPATAAGTPAQQWMFSSELNAPIVYTFDTPIAYSGAKPVQQCGRVMFSDFHVSNAQAAGVTFPTECVDGPLTPQEKTLEFMLFDLASCSGPQPTACSPKTCADFGYGCGFTGDGCDDGVVLDCGTCENGRTCGGGGDNQCGTGKCVPRTCPDANAQCGLIGDGCGGVIDCGMCPEGDQACGGGDVPNVCGVIIL